jgi:hypothetical protein
MSDSSDVDVFILAAICEKTKKSERRKKLKNDIKGATRVEFVHYFKHCA